MSSNIQISRICQFCGKEFIAKTTVTQYCGDNCSKRAYKARIRSRKIEDSNAVTKTIKVKPIEEVKKKEFLNVNDLAILLSCSRRTAYRLVKNGNIHSINLGIRKTLIKRGDIDKLFDQSPILPQKANYIQEPEIITELNTDDFYTISEIQSKFSISEKALYDMIKRNNFKKIKKGKYVYVEKTLIDKILVKPNTLF